MIVTEALKEESVDYGPPDYDGLWKRITGDLFEEFILFFAPDLYAEIDFNKEHDFLDKELYKEIIEEKKGKNIADQIVKVRLKNGENKWILIHVEVQGKDEIDFPDRMFRYFYRIYDRFERKVYAIALMTSDQKPQYPDSFHYNFYGTTVDYTYNVYKFHEHDIRQLEKFDNPFALAVIAGKYANKYKNDVDQRFHFKRKLMINVLERYSRYEEKPRTYITALIYFIDYLLQTPVEYDRKLGNELAKFNKRDGEQQMHAEKDALSPTLAYMLKAMKEQELKKAEKRGVEEGKTEGIQEATIRFAIELIKDGFQDDKIVQLTKLALQEVVELRKSLLD